MNDETLALFDDLIADMHRRIDDYERRGCRLNAWLCRVDRWIVIQRRLLARKARERANKMSLEDERRKAALEAAADTWRRAANLLTHHLHDCKDGEYRGIYVAKCAMQERAEAAQREVEQYAAQRGET